MLVSKKKGCRKNQVKNKCTTEIKSATCERQQFAVGLVSS